MTKPNVMMMQQDAAGVWGVPRLSILPPRVGDRGLTKSNVMMMQRNAAGSLRVSLSSLIISPKSGGQGVEDSACQSGRQNGQGRYHIVASAMSKE